MRMKKTALIGFLGLAAVCGACRGHAADADNAGDRLDRETNSLARKTGRAAHEIADEAKVAAKKAAKKLDEAGHDAKTGWDEAKKPSPSK